MPGYCRQASGYSTRWQLINDVSQNRISRPADNEAGGYASRSAEAERSV